MNSTEFCKFVENLERKMTEFRIRNSEEGATIDNWCGD